MRTIQVNIPDDIDLKDYVLGKRRKKRKINQAISKSTQIIDDYLVMDFEELMNKYNCKG